MPNFSIRPKQFFGGAVDKTASSQNNSFFNKQFNLNRSCKFRLNFHRHPVGADPALHLRFG